VGLAQDGDGGVSTRDKSVIKTLGMLRARGAVPGSWEALSLLACHERRRRVIEWPPATTKASVGRFF
jgi:hypothetical protein